MNPRSSIFVIIFALFTLLFGLYSVQAQTSSLLEGWCEQPSDVEVRVNERYNDEIGHSEGGVRSIWQPYNSRIVLLRTVPREVIQVVAEGITTHFELLRYTANCRYLVTRMIERGEYIVVVYDLLAASPGELGRMVVDGHNRWNIESSPEGTYLLVTDHNGLRLWNFSTNIQTHLTALARSDCDFAGVVGCSGDLDTYREARWDVPHNLLQLDLITNYTITLNLPDATINRIEATPRYSYHVPVASPDQLTSAAAAFTSEYACLPRAQYQTYNRRIVLTNRLTRELVAVVEDNLDLSGFQFLGWSATCSYFAAAIEDENGLRLAAWNVNDMIRHEHPLTDWVDRSSWATAGNTINVTTDGGQFEWKLSS